MNLDIVSVGILIIFGFIIGAIFTLFIMIESPSGIYSITQIAISECEQSIPRDQHCKIIAVIDEGNY